MLTGRAPLSGVLVNLQHYLADEDIRQRDSVYRQMQESELDRLIALLRSAAPSDALAEIGFLSATAIRLTHKL